MNQHAPLLRARTSCRALHLLTAVNFYRRVYGHEHASTQVADRNLDRFDHEHGYLRRFDRNGTGPRVGPQRNPLWREGLAIFRREWR